MIAAVQLEEIPVLTQDTGPRLWPSQLNPKDRSLKPPLSLSPPTPQARGTENIFEDSNGRIILRVIHKQLSLDW